MSNKSMKKFLELEGDSGDVISSIKLCNMLGAADPKKAQIVLQTFQNQEPNVKAILEKELMSTEINNDNIILLNYAPETMINAITYFKNNNSENPIIDGLNAILPTFARVYSQTRANLARKNNASNVTNVMINEITKKAGENPNELAKINIELQSRGNDFETRISPIHQINNNKSTEFPITVVGKTVVIGMGGGSDCIQAAILAKIMQQKGIQCSDVISIRTNKTASQDSKGNMGEERTIQNATRLVDKDIYLISSETTGSGRFLENVPAEELNVYLIIDREDGNLKQKIEKTLAVIGDVENLIGVDTGGDVLYPLIETSNQSITTPDQDRRVLETINSIQGINKKCCIIGIGIDSPDCANSILQGANASYYEPDEKIKQEILDTYNRWDMTGKNEKKFGKTPLAWQQALNGKTGIVCLNIPTKYVLDRKNPWIPFVNIQSATQGLFFMDTQRCIDSIKQHEKNIDER